MDLDDRIKALSQLGEHISQAQWVADYQALQYENPWFIEANINQALNGILKFLDLQKLYSWVGSYKIDKPTNKTIGLILAGNIPAVGFHDLLSVFISGHKAKVKLSHQDRLLTLSLFEELVRIVPDLAAQVQFVHSLDQNIDAIIATGSDNTSRYISDRFQTLPKLIRRNRTSHAVINGTENKSALLNLGRDVFSYFGKGCRNVSKIWIPNGYLVKDFRTNLGDQSHLLTSVPYGNNYRFQKALRLTGEQPFVDLGHTLMIESKAVVSPIATLYYEHYENAQSLSQELKAISKKLQCVVSDKSWFPRSIPFGETQVPDLTDYADNVDTLKFLLELN